MPEPIDERAQRLQALATLDLAFARRFMPGASGDDVRIAAMHKARYDCTDLSVELRHASGDWLRAHGMGALGGRDLLPPGQLPDGTSL